MNNQRKNQNDKLLSGERQVKNNLSKIEKNHLWRYNEACKYITNNDLVLDVGMGCGYGSFILSKKAKEVIGIDDSKEAVEYAKQNWAAENIKHINGNALQIGDFMVDVTVAFEIIEHLKDDIDFINYIKDLSKKYIIISVPHISVPLTKSSWHWRHYTNEDITNLFVDENWIVERLENPIFGKGKAVFAIFKRIN